MEKELNQKEMICEDGIIDEELYNKAKYKILWILKEPSTNFSVKWFKGKKNCFTKNKWRTFKPVAECAHILLHDEFTKQNTKLSKTMQEIAIINIKQTPGNTKSENEKLKSAYKQNKEDILSKINTIAPDIIIFGNTMKFLKADIELKKYTNVGDTFSQNSPDLKKYKDSKNHKYYMNKDRLWISTWHPNRKIKGLTNKVYASSIRNCLINWLNFKNNLDI